MSETEPRCTDDASVGAVGTDGYALISRVQAWGHANIVPVNASIEITQKCNIRCLHCYNFDRDEPRERCDDKPELTTEEILGVLDDLRAMGCLFVMFTGGEVLSDKRLFLFLDRARELNLSVQLLTNGTMLQPGIAARLAAYQNLQGVSVSLYGSSPEVHDSITQVVGSWRRTWEGARRLKNLGVVVRLKFITMKQNAHELAAMIAQATSEEFAYSADLSITPRHDGNRGSLETRVDLEQLEMLYRGPLRHLVTMPREPASEENFPCNCARGNVAVMSNGDVQPCISVPWTAGNVRQQRLAEIWKSAPVFEQIRGLKIADYEKCSPCSMKDHCKRDRSSAYTSTGSYTGADPFTCATTEVAKRVADEIAAERASAAVPVRRLAIAR